VITEGEPKGGTALTIEMTHRHRKPCLVVDLVQAQNSESITAWASIAKVNVLNIAGPRESKAPGIYKKAKELLRSAFAAFRTNS
jgi:hypothetical protein